MAWRLLLALTSSSHLCLRPHTCSRVRTRLTIYLFLLHSHLQSGDLLLYWVPGSHIGFEVGTLSAWASLQCRQQQFGCIDAVHPRSTRSAPHAHCMSIGAPNASCAVPPLRRRPTPTPTPPLQDDVNLEVNIGLPQRILFAVINFLLYRLEVGTQGGQLLAPAAAEWQF